MELPFPAMELSNRGWYKVFGVVTNRSIAAHELIRWSRQRCGKGEEVHSVLKSDLAGGRLPSGLFGANAAWWAISVLAFNPVWGYRAGSELCHEAAGDEYAQRVNAQPVGGPRSNLPRPRSDPGWAAQGGGGRNIRSPPRTGPWIGPGVVAEPPREPRRAVLGRCGCDSVPLGLKGGANAIGGSHSHDAAGGVRVPASLSYELVGDRGLEPLTSCV